MTGYFVTGGTGFIGGALALELLRRTEAPVGFLTRNSEIDAGTRLIAALRAAACAYDYPDGFVDSRLDRIHVVAGDLTMNSVRPVVERTPFRVTEMWHCAASLRYEDKYREEIFATNVDGTKQALEMAARLGVDTCNHFSTAYVAGRRRGDIGERIHAPDSIDTNNHYERSKIEAEAVVVADHRFRTRIWRPSIVIGHSRTLAATSFSGLYGFMRDVLKFRREVSDKLGSFLSMRPLQVMAEPDSLLNFIPIDHVVEQAVTLAIAGVDADVIHLTNKSAPTVEMALAAVFQVLGMHKPGYVASKKYFTTLDSDLDDGMDFYASYLKSSKIFDQAVARSFATEIDFPIDQDTLVLFCRWYLKKLGALENVAVA
jgi:nucleoside-diphosphate-sugar epimerase